STCGVAAWGLVQATREELVRLRQQPGQVQGEPLPATFLKHADEQTVVGLAAVLQAAQATPLTGTNFTHWGVVAAPRVMGRGLMGAALRRFATEGAWGVSPHVIPHRSLHAMSGTISQALQIHGPNFGAGGGPGSAGEAVLAAYAMLAGDRLPGVWLVLTGW